MLSSLLALALAAGTTTLASPTFGKGLPATFSPVAIVSNGTVIGSSSGGVDSFLGVPFATPPVGNLRLRAPQAYNSKYPKGLFNATSIPNRCIQMSTPPGPPSTVPESEDCLTINIQRPAGTLPGAKLPVLFWIYGGAFEFGSTSDRDGTQLVQAGISGSVAGNPIIYVAVNYRLGSFGFLGGQDIQNDGSSNLGLRDQRLGLQWVAENIAAFGGDPSKVTIWGESAGAWSVFDHLIVNGGDNTYKGQPLFRAAIMNSGSVLPANSISSPKAQAIYDQVSSAAGCAGAPNALKCLRSVDTATLKAAGQSVPNLFSYRSLDISYLPRPDTGSKFFATSPDAALAASAYAKVPVLIGDVEDEGTLFAQAQTNLTTTDDVVQYIQSFFPTAAPEQIQAIVNAYPDDQSAGSPFRTGQDNAIYPQYKRLAALLGDMFFTLSRRLYLSGVASTVPAWSFLDTHLYGSPVVGTSHQSDLDEIYSSSPSNTTGEAYQTYYTSFVTYLDPNKISTQSPLARWPQYRGSHPQLVNLTATGTNIIDDSFRAAQAAALSSAGANLRL